MAKHQWTTNNPVFTKIGALLTGRQVNNTFWVSVGGMFAFPVVCILLIENANTSKVQYVPEDIVYSHPISAVHGTGSTMIPVPISTNSSSEASPQIVISEHFYDFGTVKTPRVVERVFIIANHGQAPLVIQSAYTTCGCTTAEFTSSEIPPGKVALMTLHFDTGFHEMRGTAVRRGVILQTNDPAMPQQEIWFQATVK